MTNQSFDSNGNLDSGADPIPIAQQLGQQSYLSNIQHQMEALLKASDVEVSDETSGSAIPSSSATPPSSDSTSSAPSSKSSTSGRVNKMDSFFAEAAAEKAAAEQAAAELAAAKELEVELVADAEAENTNADTEAGTEQFSLDSQQVTFQPEATSDQEDSSETPFEAPLEAPADAPRPTGYAGLSAGLAAAGLGNLGARIAQESTSTSDSASVTEESQLNTELPPPPKIPVIEPSFPGHQFDLEAARLEEVSGPVFSQEFEEKELSPEERLANRLKRENLVPVDDPVVNQPLNSPPSAVSEDNADDDESVVAAEPLGAELSHDHSEPVADLFVEIPQVRQSPEVDLQEDQGQPWELPEQQEPSSIDEPAEDSSLFPPMPAQAHSIEASPSESPQSLSPEIQAPEAPVDPRLVEAKRLEEQFKDLQEQKGSYVEQAQREQFEHERATAENSNFGQQKIPTNEQPEAQQNDKQEKSAAIIQAERVKEARKKVEARKRASQVARNAMLSASQSGSSEDPNLTQENTDAAPQPTAQPDDAQLAHQPSLIPPAPLPTASLQSEISPWPSEPPTSVEHVSKRPTSGYQFQRELFHACMLEHLSDGVIFVDHKRRVKMWSRGAERATGIIPNVVLDRPLLPQTINLCDTNGNGLQLDKCPVAESLRTLEVVTGEYKITNSTKHGGMKVELTVIPVIDQDRYVNGAVVMFHDRTAQVNLQRQLKDLYEFSVLDPLTQVANRAEFERVQQEYVLAFQQSDNFNCSIIICDIDYFKSINDNFGHAVGDEALMSFAEMLKRYVRPQDLVARYGGEEFVILCADCDTAAAVQRAEEIRMALYKTPQPMLEGKSISASFGVSELREGDTAMDFFVRADTALLKAKETGRNRVVAGDGSLPIGPDETATELSETGIRWNAQQRKSKALICEEFKTETPIQLLVEKLRGFIVENDALLQRVEPEFLSMEIQVEAPMDYSRKGAFTMNVEFKETDSPADGATRTNSLNYIRVTIYAGRLRNWFSTNHTDLAPHLLGELRRFLMIGDKESRLSVDMATSNVRD